MTSKSAFILFRDLLDKQVIFKFKGPSDVFLSKTKMSIVFRSDKDSTAVKAAFFFNNVVSPHLLTSINYGRFSSRKKPSVLTFSLTFNGLRALTFFLTLFQTHIPSIKSRDGTYELAYHQENHLQFFSKNLFDFKLKDRRYDYLNWSFPFFIHFQSKMGPSVFSIFKIYPEETIFENNLTCVTKLITKNLTSIS